MRAARRLIFASMLSMLAVGAAAAQAPAPGPANAPAPDKAETMGEIAFYVAHGDADACGPGCAEWIAAEGKIDPGAAQRLRSLLAKLGRRRPPIFLHSPGGSVGVSIELGRLIRDQKFTVSVGHAIPRGCDRDKPLDKQCVALKRSGKELEADFDPSIAMCNSGCVYVLAAAATRMVPPWVKLGIHDVGFDPDRRSVSAAAAAEGKRIAHARLQDFSRDVGIDKALLTAAFAVPFESGKMIDRDEIVHFGIDRREFGEDVWRFVATASAHISKRFFFGVNSGEQRHYRNAELSLACGPRPNVRLILGLAHDSDHASAGLPPLGIDVDGRRIDLRQPISSGQFDISSGLVGADIFDFIKDEATISVSGADREDGSAGGIVLKMDGFAGAFAKLRTSCEAAAHAPPTPLEADYLGRPGFSPFGVTGSKTVGSFASQLPTAPAGGAQKDPEKTAPAGSTRKDPEKAPIEVK